MENRETENLSLIDNIIKNVDAEVEAEQAKKAKVKKLKTGAISVLAIVIAAVISIFIANACIPSLSEDEVKKLIIQEIQPQIDEINEKLGISDVTMEFDFYKYRYKKPTIFSKGLIMTSVDDYCVSDSFAELDSGKYDETTSSKYRYVPEIEFDDIKIDNYIVSISRRLYEMRFKDSDGDVYSFDYGKIYKNGDLIYKKATKAKSSAKSSDKSSSSTKSKRPACKGSVGCRKGFHPCHPMKNGFCNRCCAD